MCTCAPLAHKEEREAASSRGKRRAGREKRRRGQTCWYTRHVDAVAWFRLSPESS